MKSFIKNYWKTLLFFVIVGIVGGFFVGIYQLDSYPASIQEEILQELTSLGLNQIPADILLGIISAIESAWLALILGAIGIFLAKKIGLWKEEKSITKKPLILCVIVSVIGGVAMILFDVLFFGKYSQAILDSYANKPSVPYLLATVTYGAVVEEVLIRLFFLSLVAFVLHKLFQKKQEFPSQSVLTIGNIIASLLFAAGHLPATFILLGSSPLIIFRCFLLNGGLGFAFGWLYQKYGFRYAMIAHGGCHIVSKLIWILFI